MKESAIQQMILNGLRILGHFAMKTPAGFIKTESGRPIRMGSAGAPDIIVSLAPTWTTGWIEVKQPTGRLSWIQIKTLREHHANKRMFLIATCWDDVDKWLHDPSYHGLERFTRPVMDMSYKYDAPRTRSIVVTGLKGTPYAPYKAKLEEKIAKDRLLEPPF